MNAVITIEDVIDDRLAKGGDWQRLRGRALPGLHVVAGSENDRCAGISRDFLDGFDERQRRKGKNWWRSGSIPTESVTAHRDQCAAAGIRVVVYAARLKFDIPELKRRRESRRRWWWRRRRRSVPQQNVLVRHCDPDGCRIDDAVDGDDLSRNLLLG